MSGQPSRIEIGVPDTDRALASSTVSCSAGSSRAPRRAPGSRLGGIPAGLHRDERGPELLVFYSVGDIDEAARRIVELGGEVDEAGGEDETGRWLYSCRDVQGVTFGLHEPPPSPLLQQSREAAVLEHPAAGLLLRAVVGLVLGEEDRLDRRAAARAGLALVLVDPQRLRGFVGQLLALGSSPRSGRSRRRGRAAPRAAARPPRRRARSPS